MTVALLEIVKGMPLIPHHCILCANNPVDEQTGEQQEALFAPGIDVNFGDSVYICAACCEIISDLRGRATKAGFDELMRKYKNLKTEHEALVEKDDHNEARLDRIRDGNKAAKEVKNETKRVKAAA